VGVGTSPREAAPAGGANALLGSPPSRRLSSRRCQDCPYWPSPALRLAACCLRQPLPPSGSASRLPLGLSPQTLRALLWSLAGLHPPLPTRRPTVWFSAA